MDEIKRFEAADKKQDFADASDKGEKCLHMCVEGKYLDSGLRRYCPR